MENDPTILGKPISAKEAKLCMDAYTGIYEALQSNVVFTSTDPSTSSVRQYYKKNYNAYIFSKEMVLRFFDGEKKADYLMVLLGAQPADDTAAAIVKNDPTIILVGCTQNPDGRFVSLDIDDPATEHPPKQVIPSFPLTDKQIELVLI